jgi:hypothetical protein
MEHFDPYLSEMEIRRRMEELQLWVANERLACEGWPARTWRASRISVFVRCIVVLMRRLSGWRRIAHNETTAPIPKLTSDALVPRGRYERC